MANAAEPSCKEHSLIPTVRACRLALFAIGPTTTHLALNSVVPGLLSWAAPVTAPVRLHFLKPRQSNGCQTSVKLRLSSHLPGSMN